MRTDVNAFLGSYPYRRVPGTTPDALLAAMDRTGGRLGGGFLVRDVHGHEGQRSIAGGGFFTGRAL